jgi:hypothetical protein
MGSLSFLMGFLSTCAARFFIYFYEDSGGPIARAVAIIAETVFEAAMFYAGIALFLSDEAKCALGSVERRGSKSMCPNTCSWQSVDTRSPLHT